MSIFEKASRAALRFDTPKGALTVEDLWKLPLRAERQTTANLNDIAKALHKQVKGGEDIDFVPSDKPQNKSETELCFLRFDVVKHIISTRMNENKTQSDQRALLAQKQVLMKFLEEKQIDGIKNKSESELLADLEKLQRQIDGEAVAA